MSTALVQGGNLSLGKVDRHLASVFVGLSWEVPQGNPPLEIDASLFLLTAARVVRNDDDFIFYNQESDVAGAVYRVPSDELDEASDRDGFVIRLNELDEEIQRVAFCLSLYEGNGRGKDFSAASVLRARLVNQDTEMELAHYQSENDVSCETALILAELYRYREEWKFRAVGQGFKGGLNALATHFGVLVSGGDNQLQAQAHSGSVGNAPLQTARLPVSLEKDVPATDGKPRRRRTLHDILNAQVEDIKRRYRLLQPLLRRAAQGSPNESQSRLLLDRILQDVLGYELDEIKTEQKIQGRSADYVLAPTGQDTLVIEAKKMGGPLRDKQIFQATSYAAYSGIRWALLTNVLNWQLYRVSTEDKVEATLVFTFDLQDNLDNDTAYLLMLLSKKGIMRRDLLDKLWRKRSALSPESLLATLFNEEVLNKMRAVLMRERQCPVSNQEIQDAIEREILR